ncbi:MAG: GNAT family N-acetyltransferase [Aquisalimonadaceae bacterium]
MQLLDVRKDRERINRIWPEFEKHLSTEYFLSSAWVGNWLDSLPDQVHLKLALGMEGKDSVWACFLGSRRLVRKHLIRSRSLFLNATGNRKIDRLSIEYNRILMHSGRPPLLWDVLAELETILPWDEFVLPGLSAGAFPGNALDNCPPSWQLVITRDDPSPYVDLSAVRDSGDYVSLLGRNARSQMRRCVRAYEQQGAIAVAVADDADQALGIFRELVDLHQRRWRNKGLAGAFANDYVFDFHQRLIKDRFSRGEIQLIRVSAGRHTVGCLYNFVFNGRVLFYQCGFSPASDNRMKPGWLCHLQAVRHNARAGNAIYDFLAGGSQYKNALSTHRNRIVWAKVQKRLLRFELERQAISLKRRMRTAWSTGLRGA